MKRLLSLSILCLSCLAAQAQTLDDAPRRQWDDAFMHDAADSLSADSVPLAGVVAGEAGILWNAPVVDIGGFGLGGYDPYYGDFGSSWRLHEGFNAQFGLSLSAAFGKNAPRGVGFGQNAAFAYVCPLGKKFSVAAGVFAANMDWGSWRRTDVGIGGVLAYQVNDRISLYAYGSKSFLPRQSLWGFGRRDPFPLFLDRVRDRLGVAAEFKVGNDVMIGVSVERRTY